MIAASPAALDLRVRELADPAGARPDPETRIMGTPEQAAERLRAYAQAGVERIHSSTSCTVTSTRSS